MTLDRLSLDPRVTVRNRAAPRGDGAVVVLWMERALRAGDNPALDVAVRAANLLDRPVVAFVQVALGVRANARHYRFFLDALPELRDDLAARGVGFVLRGPDEDVAAFAREASACLVVGDEDPVREAEAARERAARALAVPLWTVDANVVVPSRLLGREHWAARTIRPRIHAELDRFLVAERGPRPRVRWSAASGRALPSLDPRDPLLDDLAVPRGVSPVRTFRAGSRAAREQLRSFVRDRLAGYARRRNRPDLDGTSRLSPWLRFGQIGPREVALAVRESGAPRADRDAFLEELIVRRELAVNFVRYNPDYDRLEGCERWALATLRRHARDRREPVPLGRLAAADSPDPVWNAAQAQMLETGWMHGFLRMYWAKRLLVWTRSPEEAFALAVVLNDTWELDGGDPNSYAGVAWAVGGKHDRAFAERPVFGKVRYMSPAAALRRPGMSAYLHRFGRAAPGALFQPEAELRPEG